MKSTRSLTGNQLIKGLAHYGYVVTRQKGSHIRLTTLQHGQHHVTVPAHDPISIGTLSAILSDVAEHFQSTKDVVLATILN